MCKEFHELPGNIRYVWSSEIIIQKTGMILDERNIDAIVDGFIKCRLVNHDTFIR